MSIFEIVAHRGAHEKFPENTIPAFKRTLELGADAIELDVRLTADFVPVVYHYFYLDEITSCSGPIFRYTLSHLRNARVAVRNDCPSDFGIPTLHEVLEVLGGKIGLEIELKGPEPESSTIVAKVLSNYRNLWDRMEVTSYEPMLLFDIHQRCPGLPIDLLLRRTESWTKSDVITHEAIHRSRLAHARAVHLHPTQLSHEVVSTIRQHGLEVHAWDVNDRKTLEAVLELNISRIDTDKLEHMLDIRRHPKSYPAEYCITMRAK